MTEETDDTTADGQDDSAVEAPRVRPLRCPGCRRGCEGQLPVDKGIYPFNGTRKRTVQDRKNGPKRVVVLRSVVCRDCGHSWWTRFYDRELKVTLLLDQQRQLPLPGTGSEIPSL